MNTQPTPLTPEPLNVQKPDANILRVTCDLRVTRAIAQVPANQEVAE